MAVGIGTVTATAQLHRARQIGAHFCFSPGLSERLVGTAQQLALPYLPGVSTVSEVMRAWELGLYYLKFFPAQAAGGTKTLTLFRELFPDTRFCPTGGINADNCDDYLRQDNVFCVGGSWLRLGSRQALPIEEASKNIARCETTLADCCAGKGIKSAAENQPPR